MKRLRLGMIGKRSEDKKDDIYFILLPMLLGICLCVVCLVGSTFAWFSATQTASVQPIRFADYTVEVGVSVGETPVAETDGVYALQTEQTYTITLAAKGTATTGYCIIYLGAEGIHTVPISANESKTFELIIHKDVNIKIVPQWGTSSKTAEEQWDGQTPRTYGVAAKQETSSVTESEPSDGADSAVPPTESEASEESVSETPSEVTSEPADAQKDAQTTV